MLLPTRYYKVVHPVRSFVNSFFLFLPSEILPLNLRVKKFPAPISCDASIGSGTPRERSPRLFLLLPYRSSPKLRSVCCRIFLNQYCNFHYGSVHNSYAPNSIWPLLLHPFLIDESKQPLVPFALALLLPPMPTLMRILPRPALVHLISDDKAAFFYRFGRLALGPVL